MFPQSVLATLRKLDSNIYETQKSIQYAKDIEVPDYPGYTYDDYVPSYKYDDFFKARDIAASLPKLESELNSLINAKFELISKYKRKLNLLGKFSSYFYKYSIEAEYDTLFESIFYYSDNPKNFLNSLKEVNRNDITNCIEAFRTGKQQVFDTIENEWLLQVLSKFAPFTVRNLAKSRISDLKVERVSHNICNSTELLEIENELSALNYDELIKLFDTTVSDKTLYLISKKCSNETARRLAVKRIVLKKNKSIELSGIDCMDYIIQNCTFIDNESFTSCIEKIKEIKDKNEIIKIYETTLIARRNSKGGFGDARLSDLMSCCISLMNDDNMLLRIVKDNPFQWLRKEAVGRMSNSHYLKQIVLHEPNRELKDLALSKITDQTELIEIYKLCNNVETKTIIPTQITNYELTYSLFENEPNPEIKENILSNIKDDKILLKIYYSDTSAGIKAKALKLIRDIDLVIDVANKDLSDIAINALGRKIFYLSHEVKIVKIFPLIKDILENNRKYNLLTKSDLKNLITAVENIAINNEEFGIAAINTLIEIREYILPVSRRNTIFINISDRCKIETTLKHLVENKIT